MKTSVKKVSFGALALVLTVSAAVVLKSGYDRVQKAEAELAGLKVELLKTRSELGEAIRRRAELQEAWLKQGTMSDESEIKRLQELSARVAQLKLATAEDFGAVDQLQNQISDGIARKLAAGTIAKDLAKDIEKADMGVQRRREAYFGLVKEQRRLLKTPWLRQVASSVPEPAPIFPAENMLLEQKSGR